MKVLVLGIDALDCLLLQQFAENLPNFSNLQRVATNLKVCSTFPPDSDTAWATISTGLNPAQHGIVRFVDPLEKSYQILNTGIDNTVLQGNTFWEVAGQGGFKVCAIFPHLCYPLWEAPATMIVRGTSVADVQARPADFLNAYPDPGLLLGVRGFPERGVKGLLKHAKRLADLASCDAEFALRILRNEDRDLFFVYWSTIDAIGHFFWRYFDQTDPGFVEGHPLQRVIPETYELYDDILGRFLNEIENDVAIIVISDHGHGTRPYQLVNVNEILRQADFLITNDLKKKPHLYSYEMLKRLGATTISRFSLGKPAGRILRTFPGLVQNFTRPASINWEETIAYATDMSGIKSYSYGGIIINRSALNGRNYEAVRDEILDLIENQSILKDGTPLVKFIARREEIYAGPYIDKYPDILLEFEYGYGVGWATDVPLFTKAYTHNLVPGSHRGDTGTCIIRSNRLIQSNTVDLRQIKPTILDLLGIKGETHDGDPCLFRSVLV